MAEELSAGDFAQVIHIAAEVLEERLEHVEGPIEETSGDRVVIRQILHFEAFDREIPAINQQTLQKDEKQDQ